MFGNMDLGGLGEMLSEVQKKTQELQEKSLSQVYEAKSGGGMVTVQANGKGEMIDITIDESLMDDREALQILIISAVNEVNRKIEAGRQEAAMGMLGNMGQFMKPKA